MSTENFQFLPPSQESMDTAGEYAQLSQMLEQVKYAGNRLETELSQLKGFMQTTYRPSTQNFEFLPPSQELSIIIGECDELSQMLDQAKHSAHCLELELSQLTEILRTTYSLKEHDQRDQGSHHARAAP